MRPFPLGVSRPLSNLRVGERRARRSRRPPRGSVGLWTGGGLGPGSPPGWRRVGDLRGTGRAGGQERGQVTAFAAFERPLSPNPPHGGGIQEDSHVDGLRGESESPGAAMTVPSRDRLHQGRIPVRIPLRPRGTLPHNPCRSYRLRVGLGAYRFTTGRSARRRAQQSSNSCRLTAPKSSTGPSSVRLSESPDQI